MITLNPIGLAYNERHEIEDDYWGEVVTKIILDRSLPEESLSEIDVIFTLRNYFLLPHGREKQNSYRCKTSKE